VKFEKKMMLYSAEENLKRLPSQNIQASAGTKLSLLKQKVGDINL
jgi:hypothetical protein